MPPAPRSRPEAFSSSGTRPLLDAVLRVANLHSSPSSILLTSLLPKSPYSWIHRCSSFAKDSRWTISSRLSRRGRARIYGGYHRLAVIQTPVFLAFQLSCRENPPVSAAGDSLQGHPIRCKKYRCPHSVHRCISLLRRKLLGRVPSRWWLVFCMYSPKPFLTTVPLCTTPAGQGAG